MPLTTDSICLDVSLEGNVRGFIYQVQACVYVWYWEGKGRFKCSINIKMCLWHNAKHKEAEHKSAQIAQGITARKKRLWKSNFVLMFVLGETAYCSV